MAVAIIEIPIGLKDKTTLSCELGVGLIDGAAVVTGLALTQKTGEIGTYRATTTAALVGLHWIRVYDAVSGGHKGNWYIWMTNEANVHLAVDYPNVVDRFGKMESTGTGGGGGGATAEEIADEVWLGVGRARSLTQSAAQVAAIMAGTTVSVRRGDTVTVVLTGVGSLVGRSKLWFSGKESHGQSEDEAEFRVEEIAGLERIGRAAPVDGETATLVVDDEVAGDVTLTIVPNASKLMRLISNGKYDVQVKIGVNVYTRTEARLDITGDVTRATE